MADMTTYTFHKGVEIATFCAHNVNDAKRQAYNYWPTSDVDGVWVPFLEVNHFILVNKF